MSSLNQWAASVIGCSVILLIIEGIMPKNSLYKPTRFLCRLVFILCIAIPLCGGDLIELSLDEVENVTQISENMSENMTEQLIKENITKIIMEEISKDGIIPVDIRIDISMTKESVIFNALDIYLPSKNADVQNTIKKRLEDVLELPINVLIFGSVENG